MALHVISARADSRGITLGQLAAGEKSNEITAVPKLLRQLDVKGWVVSLHAMGSHHRTAAAIVHAGADRLLALKGNQGTLHDGAATLFAGGQAMDWIDGKERLKWLGLRSVMCAESVRHLPGVTF